VLNISDAEVVLLVVVETLAAEEGADVTGAELGLGVEVTVALD
jgi:hypothetical protein